MRRYLLDTNICIFLLKAQPQVLKHIELAGAANCFISEITVAELLFGVEKGIEKSPDPAAERRKLDEFIATLQILPISQTLRIFACEKRRLQRLGHPIDEFDLFIGATSLAYDLTMITNNTKDFILLDNIILEDWLQPPDTDTDAYQKNRRPTWSRLFF